jgi:gliding motility-associated-like protein
MKLLKILVLIFYFSIYWIDSLSAQGNFTPCFKTDITKGCAPLRIRPNDCSGAGASLIFYDYGDGRGPVPDKEVTYSRAGRYAITQYINTGGGGGMKTDGQYFIEVSTPINPTFEVQFCSNFTVNITINSKDFNEYFVDLGNGQSRVVKGGDALSVKYGSGAPVRLTVYGNTSTANPNCGSTQQMITPLERQPKGVLRQVKVLADDRVEVSYALGSPNANYSLLQTALISDERKKINIPNGSTTLITTDKISNFELFRYRILASDKCGGEEEFAYEAISTIRLRTNTSKGKNTLVWNILNDLGFVNYTIYKDGNILRTITNINATTYEDTDVKCGQEYCYRIEANTNEGTTKSISATQCISVSRESNPKPVAQFVANVVNNSIEIRWQVPTESKAQTTFLLRTDEKGNATRIQVPNIPPFIDTSADLINKDYCYKLFYIDECGNAAPESSIACPIRLALTEQDNEVILNWVATGASNVVLEKLDERGNPYRMIPTSGNSLTEPKLQLDRQLTRYRMRGIVNGILIYSNIVSIRVNAQLQYPNAFSPNNDGLNDTFGIKGSFINDFHLQIFNRWGTLVYESTDINAIWDGRFNGELVPEGAYILTIEGRDTIGKKVSERTVLTVVK